MLLQSERVSHRRLSPGRPVALEVPALFPQGREACGDPAVRIGFKERFGVENSGSAGLCCRASESVLL
jgi:hypothetical protein